MTVTNQKSNILCGGDEGKEAEKETMATQANTRVRACQLYTAVFLKRNGC
jgi:hypothetical protein